jgi:riboflavin kinase/FMN adenylyltransferase
MNIIDLKNNANKESDYAVALGNFDGLHIGHSILIKDMIDEGKKRGLKNSVLIFKNYTKSVVYNKNSEMLTSNEQKFILLEDMGIDTIYMMNFDKDMMHLSPEDFVKNILVDKMRIKLVAVGFNYSFGYKAQGKGDLLAKLGNKYNFDVKILPPVYKDGLIVSSTLIKDLIREGNISKANSFLGRPFSMAGKVIYGKRRGSSLGFPTANIERKINFVVPKSGVYETSTIVGDKEYRSLTNIGSNPTFNNNNITIETYILNFNENIYGKEITVNFLRYLREEKKFSTKEELIIQMHKDVNMVKSD